MLFSQKQIVYGMSKGLAQFWMVIASFTIAVNLFLILTLLQMAPKLQVVPQILTTSPMHSSQLLQTEPFSQNTSDKKLIDETLLRFYLEARYTSFGDKTEMSYRWGSYGPVAFFSAPDIYRRFAFNLKERLTALQSESTSTSIDILSISRLDNIFTVEFDIYQYNRGQIAKRRRVAVIEIAYSPGRRAFNRMHSNPYGMYIKKFTEKSKRA